MKNFLCLVFIVSLISSCKNGFWTLDRINTLCVFENGDSTRICHLLDKGILEDLRPVRVGHKVVVIDSNSDLDASIGNNELVIAGGGFGRNYYADNVGTNGAVRNLTQNPINLPYHSAVETNQNLDKGYVIGGLIKNDALENIDLLLSHPIDFQQATSKTYQYGSNGWSEGIILQVERAGHTATRFNDSNEIFVIGGHPTESKLEIFTPDIASVFGMELIQNRYFHTATALFSKEILIVGGVSFDSGEISNSIEIYTPSNPVLTDVQINSDFSPRIGHTVNAVENQGAVIIGGKDDESFHSGIWMWDSDTDSLQKAKSDLPIPTAYHTTTDLPKGLLLIAGGQTPMGVSDRLFLFDPVSQKRKELDCTLTFARYGHTTTLVSLPDEELEFSSVKLLVIGGRNENEAVRQIEEIELNLACTFF